ncbi:Kinesin heavy chain [Armadillidium nasatum]|uniref:Kinesin heavy chain n=1 Tax=Armadillidium nasatum TaxID=96803 RepID=A0A5N5T9C3_9CRUS|nr:Kinesin heavy chain [Armadillidium nasatum]
MTMSNEVQQPEERSRGDEDSIQVVARFRPLNDSEERAGSRFIVSFPQVKGQEDTLVSIASKVYQFDSILKPNITQEKVYNTYSCKKYCQRCS